MFRVIENFVSTGTEIQISGSDSSVNNEPKQEKGGAKLLKDFLKDFGETLFVKSTFSCRAPELLNCPG